MARKKKVEEHENHERWLVSYADFITLLFAFFVVMYSISSVNEGKYRVLSSSIVSAFNKPAKSLAPIQQGTQLRSPIIQHKVMQKDKGAKDRVGVDYQIMPSAEEMAKMQKVADEVTHNLQDLVDEGLVNVNKTSKGLEIEINSEILFASGTANLSSRAQTALKRIATILKKQDNQINVEGFTDNVPIRSTRFPSNWELSAARAASVVHLFTKTGIVPKRLAAIGYGEFKPIAPNSTQSGRRKNRRVAIMMLNQPAEERVVIDDRTREEKERDARRKLMKSFGGADKKLNGIKKPKPSSLKLTPNSNNSSGNKPRLLGVPHTLGAKKAPTTSGSKPLTLKRPTDAGVSEDSKSKSKPRVIKLPQPLALPSR